MRSSVFRLCSIGSSRKEVDITLQNLWRLQDRLYFETGEQSVEDGCSCNGVSLLSKECEADVGLEGVVEEQVGSFDKNNIQ
jgi:hypothetical protein